MDLLEVGINDPPKGKEFEFSVINGDKYHNYTVRS